MKLNEISDAIHLAKKAGDKSKSFDSQYQFSGFMQGKHGVTKKKVANGKTYFTNKAGLVCGIWDGITDSGTVYHKGEKDEA